MTLEINKDELMEIKKGLICLEANCRKEMEEMPTEERNGCRIARYFDTLKTIEGLLSKLA